VNVPAGVRNIPLPLFSEHAWNLRQQAHSIQVWGASRPCAPCYRAVISNLRCLIPEMGPSESAKSNRRTPGWSLRHPHLLQVIDSAIAQSFREAHSLMNAASFPLGCGWPAAHGCVSSHSRLGPTSRVSLMRRTLPNGIAIRETLQQ
jgi:hypothetical protein